MSDLIQIALENKIRRLQRAYYLGKPEVSDAEFDKLWEELESRYPESDVLRKVGSDLSADTGKKERHFMLMGSQDKFNNPVDMHKWLETEQIQFPVSVQAKCDGISIELQYHNGKLICALTRGDGYEGENVTRALALVQGVPGGGVRNYDGSAFTGSVRGELLIDRGLFEKVYAKDFKNPRNFVAGAVKNEKFRNYSDLSLIAYDVYSSQNSYWVCAREDRKISFLRDNNFIVVKNWTAKDETEIIAIWMCTTPKTFSYDVDGLVLKQNQVDFNDYRELRPKKQHAFKWQDLGKVTTLLDVEWSRSGTTFTPVAVLEPVDVEGSTVSRASLANPSLIRDLNLKIGDKVLVTKRGMIIPKIEEVVEHAEDGKEIEIPAVCPRCGQPITVTEKAVVCSNPWCPGNSEHQISKWLDVLDVKGFGDVMRKDLSFWNISSISSLYAPELTSKMIREYGSINCRKAFEDLWAKSKNIALAQLIAGFDIEGIGTELIGEVIKAGYDSIEKIDSLGIKELSEVNNWSEKRASVFRTGWLQNVKEMTLLLNKGYVTLAENTPVETSEGALRGLHVCVTGKLDHFSRKQIEDFLKQNGAIADSSVTKKTDLLVTNDQSSGSSKLKNAAKFGTRIISEQELISMTQKS